MNHDKLYLVHMRECVVRIFAYVSDGREAFMGSSLIQDAVLRNLQIMAESSQRLSSTLKADHPEVDWRGMAGFRNVLAHDYLNIDLQMVWNAIEHELPVLKTQIETMLNSLED